MPAVIKAAFTTSITIGSSKVLLTLWIQATRFAVEEAAERDGTLFPPFAQISGGYFSSSFNLRPLSLHNWLFAVIGESSLSSEVDQPETCHTGS